MIQNMFGEVTEEFAEGLGAMQDLAGDQFLYLPETLFAFRH
jgi:hypothetical protein